MTFIPDNGPGWRVIAKTRAGHTVLLYAGLDHGDAESRLFDIADLMDGAAVHRTLCVGQSVIDIDAIEAVEIHNYRPMHARTETTR